MPPEPKTFSLGLISPRKKKKAKSPKANNPTVFIFAKLLVFLLSSCGCFMRECHSLLWWSLGWLEAGKSVFVEPVGSRTLLVFSPPCLQHAAFPFSEFDLSLKKVQCSGHQGLRASCLGDKGSQDYLRVESDPTPPPKHTSQELSPALSWFCSPQEADQHRVLYQRKQEVQSQPWVMSSGRVHPCLGSSSLSPH